MIVNHSEHFWNYVNILCCCWVFSLWFLHSAENGLLCKESLVDLVLKIAADIGQSRLPVRCLDIADFVCFRLEMSAMSVEMALKSSLWGEACCGNRTLLICLCNENHLVCYCEKNQFVVLTQTSSHPMRLSAGQYIKTSGLNPHMCSFTLKCLLLMCSLDPWIMGLKSALIFSVLKFQERFKSACPKLQAKATGRGGRSWRYCAEEQHGK